MVEFDENLAENNQVLPVVLSLVDPLAFTVKFKLQHKWTLWYDDPALAKANPKENWEDNLKKIATFESVEDFWGLLNNLKKPSEIPAGSNYHLFKEGIKPMWEVEENKTGGKWTYSQDRKKRGGPELNFCWMHTVKSFDDLDAQNDWTAIYKQ
jgi:translation initiation factor 4E